MLLIVSSTQSVHSNPVKLLSVSPDGHWVASSTSYERTVAVWRLSDHTLACEWAVNDFRTTTFFSPDSHYLVSIPPHGTVVTEIQVCDLTSENFPVWALDISQLPSITGDRAADFLRNCVVWSSDRSKLFVLRQFGSLTWVAVWDLQNKSSEPAQIYQYPPFPLSTVPGLIAAAPNRPWIVSTIKGKDREGKSRLYIHVWDLEQCSLRGEIFGHLLRPQDSILGNHVETLPDCYVDSTGAHLLLCPAYSPCITICDLNTLTSLHNINLADYNFGKSPGVAEAALSADHTKVIYVFKNCEVAVWSVTTGDLLTQFMLGEPSFEGNVIITISPDVRHVAVGYDTGIIRLYSMTSGCSIGFIRRHTVGITVLRFTPDGTTLCSGDRHGVIWFTYIGHLLSHSI